MSAARKLDVASPAFLDGAQTAFDLAIQQCAAVADLIDDDMSPQDAIAVCQDAIRRAAAHARSVAGGVQSRGVLQ